MIELIDDWAECKNCSYVHNPIKMNVSCAYRIETGYNHNKICHHYKASRSSFLVQPQNSMYLLDLCDIPGEKGWKSIDIETANVLVYDSKGINYSQQYDLKNVHIYDTTTDTIVACNDRWFGLAGFAAAHKVIECHVSDILCEKYPTFKELKDCVQKNWKNKEEEEMI